MNPVYPPTFACPTWDYALSRTEFQRTVEFDCGWARKRDQFPEHGGGVELTFEMSTRDFASWARWIKANGHDWYTIDLEPGLGGSTGPQYPTDGLEQIPG